MNILEQVKADLQRTKGQWRKIAPAAGVNYTWLVRFAQGGIPWPSIVKIQKLLDYFDAHRCDCQKEKANDTNQVA